MSTLAFDPEETTQWEKVRPRNVTPEQWKRFEGYAAEIFQAFGMDLDTPGTKNTPHRHLRAMYEATAGYEGDPKLLTAFPTECHGGQCGQELGVALIRSEEHTSELQSLRHLVCRLLLEKKKTI